MSTAAAALPAQDRFDAARLPPRELLGVALQGLRTRRLRAALSALGIAIGIGAMVAVVGVSASSQANLLATIDKLGTNLLTVTPGQNFEGNNEVLPDTSVGMIDHMQNVDNDVAVYQVSGANVLRTPFVPPQETGGIGVDAAGDNLPQVVGTSMASGHFLDAVADRYPEVVLGAQAASILEINQIGGHLEVYLGNTWFTVVGILKPALLELLDRHDRVHLAAGGGAAFPGAAEPVGDLRARERQRRHARLEPARPHRRPRRTPAASTSAGRRTHSKRAPRPRDSSRRCCSGSARWPCSWGRSGSRTSW